MREIIGIYTKSGTFNNIREIMKEVSRIRHKVDMTSFEEMARYVCEGPNGKNILVELQVSTKWCRDNDVDDYIDIVAYEFEGELEDYTADVELETIRFNGCWKSAIKQMKKLAMKFVLEEYNEKLQNAHGKSITVQIKVCIDDDGNDYYYFVSKYGESDNYDTIEEAYKEADEYLRGVGVLW